MGLRQPLPTITGFEQVGRSNSVPVWISPDTRSRYRFILETIFRFVLFLARGCDSSLDEPLRGMPRSVSDEDLERVVTRTLESLPRRSTQWSMRSKVEASGLSRATESRIQRRFGLTPHRTEFKLSKAPLFIERVRDIVGRFLPPPERAVVLRVDEKPQIQALDRTRPTLPLRIASPERRTLGTSASGSGVEEFVHRCV